MKLPENNLIKIVFLIILLILTPDCIKKSENENIEIPPVEEETFNVTTWMYQIQNLESKANIDTLYDTAYDMLVVEPGFNLKEDPYDTLYLVSKLSKKPDGKKRFLFAYIDIGEAEDYRTYWQSDWVAPKKNRPGYPDFLITTDPDGWSGNYPIAYWRQEWQGIWIGENGIIEKLAGYGFDGVYLDWIEAYDDDKVRDAAGNDGIDPENEMMLFIEKIRKKGREINSGFMIISQNAPYLLDHNPSFYSSIIDAVAMEDTWCYGEADVGWNNPLAGDLSGGERHADEYSTENRIKQSKKYLDLGIPVFTVDYCISRENADYVYKVSREDGFIPLVTRVSLSRITETPPF